MVTLTIPMVMIALVLVSLRFGAASFLRQEFIYGPLLVRHTVGGRRAPRRQTCEGAPVRSWTQDEGWFIYDRGRGVRSSENVRRFSYQGEGVAQSESVFRTRLCE